MTDWSVQRGRSTREPRCYNFSICTTRNARSTYLEFLCKHVCRHGMLNVEKTNSDSMFACLNRAARNFGFQTQALHNPQKSALPLRRWIFNPSLKPPPSGPSVRREFPQESRAHVSSDQFNAIRRPNYAIFGVIDKEPGSYEKEQTPEALWANKEPSFEVSPPGPYAGRIDNSLLGEPNTHTFICRQECPGNERRGCGTGI